jgi:hypothetical protein
MYQVDPKRHRRAVPIKCPVVVAGKEEGFWMSVFAFSVRSMLDPCVQISAKFHTTAHLAGRNKFYIFLRDFLKAS